ncbi:Attacin, partial [Gonioctena quinquepunctata]
CSFLPLGIYEENSGGILFVPLDRIRRDTTYDIQGPDLKGVIKHEGTLLSGDNYHLDGSAYAAKDLTDLKGLHKPELLGGDFRLKHDNGLSAVLGADHLRGGPTDVKAGLNYDIYHDKNFNVDLDAQLQTTVWWTLWGRKTRCRSFSNSNRKVVENIEYQGGDTKTGSRMFVVDLFIDMILPFVRIDL